MLTHEREPRASRARSARRLVVGAVLGTVPVGLVLAGASPAAADVPVAWGEVPDVSVLGFLLVLVILPVGLALVITLLTVLPTLRDKGYEPGAGWRGEPEWFGSPTKGLDAAEDVTPDQLQSGREGSGGTSARW